MYDTILIGIDEIWLKSERVKKRLMEILAKDIKYRINYENLKIGRGRIFIYEYNEDWIEKLKKIFGIKTIYPSKRVEPNLEKIKEASLYFFKNFEGSFKVSVNRVNKKFPLNSYEIAKEVGSYILENFKNLKVDVKNPEKILYIEIHSDYAFLYDKVIYGFGGLPLGSEGKGLVLFSGGTDSSSAAILMGKRGLDLDFLFINIAGYSYLNFVFRVFQKLKEYFPYSKLFVWNLEIEKLMQVRKGYKQIIFKAIIYKIAESFAKNKYDVIITGESLAQVSSQTTEAIKVLDKLVSFPILRPLIGFNKDEIIEIAKKIGIYEIKAPEICQIEKYPTTKPKYEIVIEELNKLNINFEEEVKNVYELKGLEIKEFNFNLPSKEKLIVLRTENIENFNFEKDKKYLLVCKTGMLSKYFAEKLRSQGIEAYWLDEKTAKRLGYLN